MTEICNVSKEQYKIIQNSDKEVKEVLYNYRFNGRYIDRFFVFPKEGAKDDNYYLNKAKQIVATEKENGKFAKYSFRYLEDLKIVRRKKVFLACAIPVLIVGLAIGGVYLTKIILNQPLPEIGEAAAIEVSKEIITNQEESGLMNILLDQTKSGNVEISYTESYPSYKGATSTHTISFDFSDKEFYFKDQYVDGDYSSLNYTRYYLFREAAGSYDRGIYAFQKDDEHATPDGTGNFVYDASSTDEAKTTFGVNVLRNETFVGRSYEFYMLGTHLLFETMQLDVIKAKVSESKEQEHPDAYISTNFRSDRKKSLKTKMDYVFYDNGTYERCYSNVNGVITNNLCYEGSVVSEIGLLTDRLETTYKLTPSKIEKDEGYNNWKRIGEAQ